MLDGTGKQLLELLKRLDDNNVTYDELVDIAKANVATAESSLQELLTLEGLCNATTLKTPTGRKRRRDRGQKRATKRQEQQIERQLDELVVGDTADEQVVEENEMRDGNA